MVVYASSKTDWAQLPRAAQDAFRSPQSGKYIPKTIVMDAELKEVIAIIPYEDDDNARGKLFREAKKKIAERAKR